MVMTTALPANRTGTSVSLDATHVACVAAGRERELTFDRFGTSTMTGSSSSGVGYRMYAGTVAAMCI